MSSEQTTKENEMSTGGQTQPEPRRTVTVYADELARMLQGSEGFREVDLGVRYTDDGTGFAGRIVGLERGEWT